MSTLEELQNERTFILQNDNNTFVAIVATNYEEAKQIANSNAIEGCKTFRILQSVSHYNKIGYFYPTK